MQEAKLSYTISKFAPKNSTETILAQILCFHDYGSEKAKKYERNRQNNGQKNQNFSRMAIRFDFLTACQ